MVLAVRSVDLDVVLQRLRSLPTVQHRLLQLEALTESESTALALQEKKSIGAGTAGRLARHFGANLFLLRAATQAIVRGKTPRSLLGPGKLRTLVSERFAREAIQRLDPLCTSQEALKAILMTCLDVPLPLDSASTEQRTLQAAGLLRAVGSTLRIRADVEGDLFLGYLLEQPWAQAVLQDALRQQPAAWAHRVRNLAAAGEGYPAQVIATICASWLEQAPGATPESMRETLELLPRCARAAPELVAKICAAFASNHDAPSMDLFGATIEAVASCDPLRTLQLLKTLRESTVRDGQYSNYSLEQLAHNAFTLLHLSQSHATTLLAELSGWVSNAMSRAAVEVTRVVLSSLLLPVVRWETSDAKTIAMHERGIPATPSIISIRMNACELIARMLRHVDPAVRLSASKILREHARRSGGGIISAPQLRAVQEREFKEMGKTVRSVLATEQDVHVLDAIEDGLVFRWLADRPGGDLAKAIVDGIAWPWQLHAFRLASKPAEFYLDIRKLLATAPRSDKWSWWVDRSTKAMMHGVSSNEVDDLFLTCPTTYQTPTGLLQLVDAVQSLNYPWNLLDPWCTRDPDLFARTLAMTSPAHIEILSRALRRQAFRKGELNLLLEMEHLLSTTPAIQSVRTLIEDARPLPDDQVVTLATTLVRCQALDLRLVGLEYLLYGRSLARAEKGKVLVEALRDGLWLEGWSTIWDLAHDIPEAQRAASPVNSALTSRLGDLLTSEQWDGYGGESWHVDELFKLVCGPNVDSRLQILRRASEHSLWRESVAALVAPMLRPRDRLEKLASVLGELVRDGKAAMMSCAHLLGAANELEAWSDQAVGVGRKLLTHAAAHERLIGMAILSENRSSPEACAVLADVASSDDPLNHDAEIALNSFGLPRGGWSGAVGETPPALLTVQELLRAAAPLASTPAARRLIGGLEHSLKRMIQRHRQRDEEFLASN